MCRILSAMDPMSELQPFLLPGERLLWAGRPDPGVWFTPGDLALIPLSILWCGFAVFWESLAVTGNGGAFFIIWGVPFIAAGLYFVVGRFFYKRYRKGRTIYGITPGRAIVLTGGRCTADSPPSGQPVRVTRSRDGRHASVTVGTALPARSPFGRRPLPTWALNSGLDFAARGGAPLGFYDVADPGAMLAALGEARSSSPSPG